MMKYASLGAYVGAAMLALSAAGCRRHYVSDPDKGPAEAAKYCTRADIVDLPEQKSLILPKQKRLADERLRMLDNILKNESNERMPVIRKPAWQFESDPPSAPDGNWIRTTTPADGQPRARL